MVFGKIKYKEKQMKKLTKYLCLAIICVGMCFTLVGCKAKLKEFALKEGTFNQTYMVGDEVDTSTIVMVATYTDKTTKEVKADELEISDVDTTTPGIKNVIVKWGEEAEATIKVTVYNSVEDTYIITGFEDPAFIRNYKNAIKGVDTTGMNAEEVVNAKRNEFYDRTVSYKVGNDNAFVFMPQIEAFVNAGDADTITLNRYTSSVVVEEYVGGTWVKIFDNTLETPLTSDLVSVNNATQEFKFAKEAAGNKFKLTVRPQNADEDIPSITFEFEVVNGFNVQSIEQLSVIDNNAHTSANWASIKSANGLTGIDPDAVVLHGTFNITSDILPNAYKYVQGDIDIPADANKTDPTKDNYIYGSLRTWISVYSHVVAPDKTFTIHGNYSTIDATKLPRVANETIVAEGRNEGHVMLFGLNGDNHNEGDKQVTYAGGISGNVVIENVSFKGNSGRSEDKSSKGGIGLFNASANIAQTNCIQNGFNVMYVMHHTQISNDVEAVKNQKSVFTRVKSYNAHDDMIFMYGYKQIDLVDSEFIGAGGPIAMVCHHDSDGSCGGFISNLDVINSTLESWVTGTEAWFQRYSAVETARQLIGLDALMRGATQNTKTITRTVKIDGRDTSLVNFAIIIMDADNAFKPLGQIKGTVRMFDKDQKLTNVADVYNNHPEVTAEHPENALYPANLITAAETANASAKQMPIFQSAGFGAYGTDGKTLIDFVGSQNPNNAKMFVQGDWMNIYQPMDVSKTSRMCIIAGYEAIQK